MSERGDIAVAPRHAAGERNAGSAGLLVEDLRQAAIQEAATAPKPDVRPPTVVIQPQRGFQSLGVDELWRYRELLYFLVWRDVKVRYKQTVLGASWAIIQPFFTMVVFSLFFGRLAGVPSDGIPYPLFSFAALVSWTYFANSLSLSANSLVQNRHLITKVYFPRLVIPVASVLSGIVDFLLASLVLFGIMIYYGIPPGPGVLWLPP